MTEADPGDEPGIELPMGAQAATKQAEIERGGFKELLGNGEFRLIWASQITRRGGPISVSRMCRRWAVAGARRGAISIMTGSRLARTCCTMVSA